VNEIIAALIISKMAGCLASLRQQLGLFSAFKAAEKAKTKNMSLKRDDIRIAMAEEQVWFGFYFSLSSIFAYREVAIADQIFLG
jgi:hypothetical protein